MPAELKPKVKVIVLTLFFIFFKAAMAQCIENKGTFNTLFIFSWHKDMPWQVEVENGFKRHFQSKAVKPLLFDEYLDAGRFQSENQLTIFRDYLERKYADIKIDNIIYESEIAARLFKNYPDLFKDSKKIIVNPGPVLDGSPVAASTIIPVNLDYERAVRELLKASGTKTVYLVAGATQFGRYQIEKVSDIIKRIDPSRKVVPLAGLPMRQLLDTVSELAPNGVIFYLLIFQDGQGVRYIPYEAAEEISRRAAVPVYSFWTSLMGSGIVGGYLLSGEKVGREIASILTDPDHIQDMGALDLSKKFHGFYWDWRQLKRWNIKPASPADQSTILYKEQTFYEHYYVEIILCSLTLIVFITLIWNRKLNREIYQRKIVETQLIESEDKYRNLSDAAFEGIVISDKGLVMEANSAFVKMFGYSSPEELIGMKIVDLVGHKDRDEVQQNISSGFDRPYEVVGLKKDGTQFPIEAHGKMFFYRNKKVRVSAVRDLTEKKRSEEEIKALKTVIPICMHCKGIRDDKGYWRQLERYLEEHSDAQISHGICDKCLEEKYPPMDD